MEKYYDVNHLCYMVFPKSEEAKNACIKHNIRCFDKLFATPYIKEAKKELQDVINKTGVKGFCLVHFAIHRSEEEKETTNN